MASTMEQLSEAERLEAVADATIAGPGATDSDAPRDLLSEKPAVDSSSNSSEAIVDQNDGEKMQPQPEKPQRSTLKVFLIMLSLCVSISKCEYHGQAIY